MTTTDDLDDEAYARYQKVWQGIATLVGVAQGTRNKAINILCLEIVHCASVQCSHHAVEALTELRTLSDEIPGNPGSQGCDSKGEKEGASVSSKESTS